MPANLEPAPVKETAACHSLDTPLAQPPRDFAIFRIKRHAPPALARALREIGWDPLDGWPYGADVGYPRALSLFRKR